VKRIEEDNEKRVKKIKVWKYNQANKYERFTSGTNYYYLCGDDVALVKAKINPATNPSLNLLNAAMLSNLGGLGSICQVVSGDMTDTNRTSIVQKVVSKATAVSNMPNMTLPSAVTAIIADVTALKTLYVQRDAKITFADVFSYTFLSALPLVDPNAYNAGQYASLQATVMTQVPWSSYPLAFQREYTAAFSRYYTINQLNPVQLQVDINAASLQAITSATAAAQATIIEDTNAAAIALGI
jgi:hypothetical protein